MFSVVFVAKHPLTSLSAILKPTYNKNTNYSVQNGFKWNMKCKNCAVNNFAIKQRWWFLLFPVHREADIEIDMLQHWLTRGVLVKVQTIIVVLWWNIALIYNFLKIKNIRDAMRLLVFVAIIRFILDFMNL